MEDQLIEIARFPSSFEASLVLRELEEAGVSARLTNEASAEWMTQLGTHDVGVGLLISSADAQRARTILEVREQTEQAVHYGEQEEEREQAEQESERGDPREWARRAMVAAVAGILFFPLSLYSIWLICRHGLLSKQVLVNTRGPLIALVIAIVGLAFYAILIFSEFM